MQSVQRLPLPSFPPSLMVLFHLTSASKKYLLKSHSTHAVTENGKALLKPLCSAVLLKMQIATLLPKARHLRQSPLIWGVVFVS